MWRCMVQPVRRGAASAVRMARARPPTVAATVAARAPVRLFHHCLGGGGKNCGGLGFPSPLPTRPAQTQWRLFSEQAPKRPKQQYAAPGRPGPSRNTQPVAPGARKNVANFLAAALIAATFGWAGYMYTQRTGPFKLVKTEEELAADAAREQGKLEWLRARDPDNAEVTDRVYFDIAANGKPLGRVVVGLFGKTAPRTVANFLALAGPDGIPVPAGGGDNGDRAGGDGGSGAGGKEARQVGFKGTVFHRIIPKFMIQGGDVTHNTGFGGYSLYGRSFADESFDLWHVRPGVLSMANAGPNTNSSQFFITTSATPWLDQRHVVFGRVTDGYRVVRQVERLGTKSGRPQRRVEIVRCGVMTEEHYAAYLAEVARRRAQREAEASEE